MATPYQIEFSPSALRQFRKLAKRDQTRIAEKIDALAVDPRPAGMEMLKGESDLCRIRVGDYRVVYMIQDDVLIILALKIAHRKDVYRRLPE